MGGGTDDHVGGWKCVRSPHSRFYYWMRSVIRANCPPLFSVFGLQSGRFSRDGVVVPPKVNGEQVPGDSEEQALLELQELLRMEY